MKSQTVKIILSIIIFSFCQNIFATGALYVRPRFSTQEYQKMWIKSIDVDVDIQDQVAVTHVDQIFFNEMSTSVEAIYLFPLPENAMITSMVYWFNGQRYEAEIRERQEAIADYNRALEFNQNIVELWYAKGDTHYNLSQKFEAVDSYKKVIELDPFNFECMEDLGRLYIELDSLVFAEEILLECASLSPNHANAYYLIGKIYALQNKMNKSAKFISDAIKLDNTIADLLAEEKSDYINSKVDFNKLNTLINDLLQ